MIVWVLACFILVLGVKYYTSTQGARLQKRLDTARLDLMDVKESLQSALEKKQNTETDEEEEVERVRRMKEIIDDLNMRLTTSRDEEEDRIELELQPPSF